MAFFDVRTAESLLTYGYTLNATFSSSIDVRVLAMSVRPSTTLVLQHFGVLCEKVEGVSITTVCLCACCVLRVPL